MTSNPLVSIITVTYNCESTVSQTINSILNQKYSNVEYLVVDGASTDRTLKIFDKYAEKIKEHTVSFSLVSEPDNGIADAWNKGLSKAKGELIFFLNGDDWIALDTIEMAVKKYIENNNTVIYGKCVKIKNDSSKKVYLKTFFRYRQFWNFGFSFTSCFVPKAVYNEVGGFDENYKIALDSHFLLRCINKNINFTKNNHKVYMLEGGVSYKFFQVSLEEYRKALIDTGHQKLIVDFFHFLKRLYYNN
jgi:glycosyltransferase involved in cell wall biosynthesis